MWWEAYLAALSGCNGTRTATEMADFSIELVRSRKLLFEPTEEAPPPKKGK